MKARLSNLRRKSAPTALTGRRKEDDDAESISTLESGVSQDSRRRLNQAPKSDAPENAAPGTRRRRGGPGSVAESIGSEASELSAGPEKWRRVRRGAHLSYVPFDIEDYQEAAEVNAKDQTFPPLSETSDDTKNWPRPCPFLHVKFSEFAISSKRSFIATCYYFWYFLTIVFLWSLLSAVVTNLISPSPKTQQVWVNFIIGFVGFWWFFFGWFRLMYHSMRYRKGLLYTLFELETVVLFFIACYQIFTCVGNLTQLLSPLAPGSAVPVRQNPMIGAIFLSIGAALWLIVLMYCFYFVRKAHFFKSLPLAVEKEIWLKELMPGYLELKKRNLSDKFLEIFREKPDKPYVPLRCGLLQGKDLWLQGQLLLETVYLEFKADVYVFDHLVWERVHYQDVLDVRKYGKTGLLFQVLNPSRRATEDVEIIVDFGDLQLRAAAYKVARRLWRRVGRNMDLLAKLRVAQLRKLRRSGQRLRLELEDPDPVEAFNKARRLETRERLAAHLVTYRDWQKMLAGVKIHVLREGDTLVATGDEFTKLYHVAQGRIEVSEVVDMGTTTASSSSPSQVRELDDFKGDSLKEVEMREARSWAKYTAGRGRLEEKTDEPVEYEDPETDHHPAPNASKRRSGSKRDVEAGYGSASDEDSESRLSDSDGESGNRRNGRRNGKLPSPPAASASSEYTSQYGSDVYSVSVVSASGPETVLLGTLRKDDIFGVVPFLLSKEGQAPRSGLTFTARDPITVMFSLDCEFLRSEILKPKKDVTASLYKYLAVILGERTEAAEDAMFTRKVREKRLETARAEEALLAKRRQIEEEQGFGDKPATDKEGDRVLGVRQLFNFSATEAVQREFAGRYTFRDATMGRIVKVSGTFYITTHYLAFAGKKLVDVEQLELNRSFKDVMRLDEVITVRYEGKKGILFTDLHLDRKMFEVKDASDREDMYAAVMTRWRSEDEVTSKEMRKLLRRKMTRLSLGYLTQAERLTQQTIGKLMADMTEKDKKQLFAGSVPIGLNRNQVVIGEYNFNDNLYLLCTGVVRVQRVQEHASNGLDSGKALDRVVFQEIHSGEIFGFDSFLTGAPAYSSVVVESEKAVVRSCTKDQIMARLREDRRLAATFYRIASVSIASRLAEISPLDIYL